MKLVGVYTPVGEMLGREPDGPGNVRAERVVSGRNGTDTTSLDSLTMEGTYGCKRRSDYREVAPHL